MIRTFDVQGEVERTWFLDVIFSCITGWLNWAFLKGGQ